MLSEYEICPYINKCRKYNDGICYKGEVYLKCGDYTDFNLEFNNKFDENINYILCNLSKHDINKEEIKKTKGKKNIKKTEKCPFQYGCYHIFKTPCIDSQLNNECYTFECEDCELGGVDYGEHCKTIEYEKCESYEIISILKDEYRTIGIYNTADLKKYYGEDNYEILGEYIRCAFLGSGG